MAQPHPWIQPILESFDFDPQSLVLDIHSKDEMFEQAVLEQGGDVDGGTAAYFSSAAQIARTVERVVGSSPRRVLDFGCGFGRVTRLFCASFGAEQVWASDLVEEAVEFQREVLGCHSFVSAVDPKNVVWPAETFDLVYVGSLFTHLPAATFKGWLEALFDRVEPGGTLLFSVHDEALKPAHVAMPESGIAFAAISEARDIEHEVYGSTWVKASFLEAALERVGDGRDVSWHRYPRALCGYQDLVAVTRGRHDRRLLGAVSGIGQIEQAELAGSKWDQAFGLHLAGWALPTGDSDGTEKQPTMPGFVRARLVASCASEPCDTDSGGTVSEAHCDAKRDDLDGVAAAVAVSPCAAGWQLDLKLPQRYSRGRDLLVVTVHSYVEEEGAQSGKKATCAHVLFVGSIDRLLFLVADENSRRRRDRVFELAETIEQVKVSKFWRLRRIWFVCKRMLGLTEEAADGPELLETDRRPK